MIWCRVDGSPLNYYGEKAWLYIIFAGSPATLLQLGDTAPALSPESTLFVEHCVRGLYKGAVMGRNAQEAGGSLVQSVGVVQSPWRPWTPRDAHAKKDWSISEEDQAQGACRQLPFRGSRDKSQRNRHRSKEEEQCIGDRQAGPEEEEQCVRGHMPKTQRWLGTISIDTKGMMTPRSGVSVDDDKMDGVGGKVGGVDTSVQCIDYRLR
ncbi:uncharacterized protein UHOD_12373 [Ustilago sp. UG-2017b]|nr:uncharacterized protein UHOD_12373 [Ustilago sp. UG-2017b]